MSRRNTCQMVLVWLQRGCKCPQEVRFVVPLKLVNLFLRKANEKAPTQGNYKKAGIKPMDDVEYEFEEISQVSQVDEGRQ